MIKFPKEIEEQEKFYIEEKSSKKCKKALEKSLRILGEFNSKKTIIITKYEYRSLCDIVYEIKDLNNTVFKFYNFLNNQYNKDRYNMNYELTMQKENSNFYYKYNFKEIAEGNKEIKMKEIGCSLPKNRTIILKLGDNNKTSRISIQEKNKKYKLVFNDKSVSVLENFEKIVEGVLNIETLNLESILDIIERKELSYISISEKNKNLANIYFKDSNIYKYNINTLNTKINVTISDKITRSILRNYKNVTNKKENIIESDDYEIIQSDYKRLFKEL